MTAPVCACGRVPVAVCLWPCACGRVAVFVSVCVWTV